MITITERRLQDVRMQLGEAAMSREEQSDSSALEEVEGIPCLVEPRAASKRRFS